MTSRVAGHARKETIRQLISVTSFRAFMCSRDVPRVVPPLLRPGCTLGAGAAAILRLGVTASVGWRARAWT